MRKPLMQEFSTVPAGVVRSVLRSFMVQEAEFRERAEALSREEPLSVVQDRWLGSGVSKWILAGCAAGANPP